MIRLLGFSALTVAALLTTGCGKGAVETKVDAPKKAPEEWQTVDPPLAQPPAADQKP